MNILGVKIDNLSREEILEKIEGFLSGNKPCTIYAENNKFNHNMEEKVRGRFHQIATVNPEFILHAQKDEDFKNILNNCDLNVADGAGINFAFWRHSQKLKARIAGVDLMEEILKIVSINNYKIFLAAGKWGLSTWEETRDAILKIYPNLKINGVNIDKNSSGYGLRVTDYDIVFCNFGAPFQEKFLHSLKTLNNSKIRLTMGVGGSFDYLTGKIKRAPQWMRQFGLEWLFRLISKPRYRIKRIFNAVVIFPIKIILD